MSYIRARCPWAAAHTHTSLQKYLLEETYELLAALDAHDRSPTDETRREVLGELGDVLYQVLFHAALLDSAAQAAGEESGGEPRLRAEPHPPEAFIAVVESLKAKLVRRHPHVFDSDGPVDIEEVERRYEAVKVAERAAADRSAGGAEAAGAPGGAEAAGALGGAEAADAVGALGTADAGGSSAATRAAQARASFDSVPVSMPALTRAQSVLGRIERLELAVPAVPRDDREGRGDEENHADAIGDELFSLVTRAHRLGIDAESALRQATARAEECVIRQAQGDGADEHD
jgi:NTP pyrophosphatase (non-canonical NTP hydrolase)